MRKRREVRVLPALPPLPSEAELFEASTPRRWLADIARELFNCLEELAVGEVPDLPHLAARLKVSLKKVFLCCNVLEGLGMVERGGASRFVWRGREAMASRLAELHQAATREGLLAMLQAGPALREVGEGQGQEKPTMGWLTRRLLMALLVAPGPRGLAMVARTIQGGGRASRLEEVARVLEGLGLVQEVPTTGTTSELTFQYTGPVVEAKKEVEGVDPSVVEVEVKIEVKEEESGGEE